jgi:metal-responsive CopG/Arc/MetJ family transcriptional regulator
MPTLSVRLPEQLLREIEEESRRRGCAKSDIVRERLQSKSSKSPGESSWLEGMEDLVGSAEALPSDLSSRVKHYLRAKGYGKNRTR